MEYEWDEDKNAANLDKHGIDFALIEQFEWQTCFIQLDQRFDYGEIRFRAFGRVEDRRVCVAFTPRGRKLRLISMRLMNEKEVKRYGI